jgi:hypothetical protein
VVMTIEGNQNRITMHSPASWEDMVVYLLDHVCKQDSVFTPCWHGIWPGGFCGVWPKAAGMRPVACSPHAEE